ncbi:hypothetical protein XENTR_v10019275 [Xenopus tropicalis]|nr:hypothetical protein XENTR_v10019275 [Xenopus tropicalis]
MARDTSGVARLEQSLIVASGMSDGTFIQKSDSEGRRVMVPCCGKCNAEVTRELRDFAAKCPRCQMPCWVGPFQAIGKSKDSELRSALISALEGLSVVIKELE